MGSYSCVYIPHATKHDSVLYVLHSVDSYRPGIAAPSRFRLFVHVPVWAAFGPFWTAGFLHACPADLLNIPLKRPCDPENPNIGSPTKEDILADVTKICTAALEKKALSWV